jgi:hypothetical protein
MKRFSMPTATTVALTLALTVILTLAAAVPASADEPIFRLTDPRGDDHGDGRLVYPHNDDYAVGDLDLLAFEARRGRGGTWFEATFARPVRVPDARAIDALGTRLQSAAKLGFYTLNLDVYIDMDRVPGSGATAALPGRGVQLAPDTAWERAILLTPQPHAARAALKRLLAQRLGEELDQAGSGLDEDQAAAMRLEIPGEVERRVFFPTLVRVNGSRIAFFVPDEFLGGPAEAGWSYAVAVSGADLVQSYDLQSRLALGGQAEELLMILPVAAGRPRDRFGAPFDRPLPPPLVDVLTPHGASQEAVLAGLGAAPGGLPELPGVVPEAVRPAKE